MKAVKAKKYGNSDVLEQKEVNKPVPKPNEILVRISHSAVTPTDETSVKGSPFIVRIFSGLTKPRSASGDVFAGEVEALGAEVTNFKIGDQIFGTLAPNTGSHAEYICIKSSRVVTNVPKNLSNAEAASLVDGPLTSLAFLKKHAKVKEGDNVLINGASGSVGTAAVQIAKYLGATVIGVCSGKNIELVKSLGADRVLDYTKEDFTKLNEKFDIVFDTVNKSSYGKCRSIMKPDAIYMTTGPSLGIVKDYIATRFTKQKAIMAATGPFWKQEDIETIKELAEKGILKPIIDSTYPLENIAKAFEYVGKGHKVGSVVVEIA